MKKKTKYVLWAIKNGRIIFYWTLRRRKKDCLKDWIRESGECWTYDRKHGYECVKVVVVEK